ncbi:MAG: redoxin family protein [Chthoniobacterales bacterium]
MKRSLSSMLLLAVATWAFSVSSAQAADPASSSDPLKEISWISQKFIVLFFVLHDCPICNQYVPEMNRIVQDYRSRGFAFIAVYPESDFSKEDAQKHAREYQFNFPFVIDPGLGLAAKIGIKVAPEVAVLNSKRELLYRGRIDDHYAEVDKERPAVVRHDLRQALDDIAVGIKPQRAQTPAVGCPINYEQPGS